MNLIPMRAEVVFQNDKKASQVIIKTAEPISENFHLALIADVAIKTILNHKAADPEALKYIHVASVMIERTLEQAGINCIASQMDIQKREGPRNI